jgi:predicted MFS family arabinose efflux permease
VAPRLQRVALGVTVPLGLVVFAAGALLLATAPGSLIALGFAAVGVGNGVIDVFVNVGSQRVEADIARPVLQYVHASYNVGGIAGALGAGVSHGAGLDYPVPIAASAVLCLAAALWCWGSASLRDRPPVGSTDAKVSLAVFRHTPFLIVPAIVVLSGFMVEGSMDIWSVIYLRESLEASAVAGGIAFAAFSLAMAIGRVTAARSLFGLGYRTTLLVSGAGTLVAGLTAALASNTLTAGIAFLFLGFFIASAAPAAFGMISRTDADPVLAVAGMTTIGYSGFVIGPPVMGALAERVGLRATMTVLVAMGLGVLLGGILAPPGGGEPHEAP